MERIQISKTEKSCKIIHFECPIKVSGNSLRLKNIPAEAHLHLKCPLAPQENMPKSMESEYLTKNHNLTFLMWNQIHNYKDLNSTKLQKIHNNWSTKAFSNLYTFSRIVNRFKEFSRFRRGCSKKSGISKNFKRLRNVEHIKLYIHFTQKIRKPQNNTHPREEL